MLRKPFSSRVEQLRKLLKQQGLDALLVTNGLNVTYLTGFQGDSSNLLVAKNKLTLVSDTRFETQIRDECPGLDCEIRDAQTTTLALTCKLVQAARVASLGIEADNLTKASYDELAAQLPAGLLVDSRGLIEQLRAVKDREEQEKIRRSIRVNERAFEVLRARLVPSASECQLAFDLEHQMRQFGASQAAFKPIIASGPRSALPHAIPSRHVVGESPFLLVDWGSLVEGYASDLTRVLILGKAPAKYRKIYEVVREAQERAIAMIRPGVTLKEVDRAARGLIEAAGCGKYFGHGLGHGIGLQVHELPFLSPIRDGHLQPGMVVTVEPGIYLPDFGGVRIEDNVLVTPEGHELLSTLPRDYEAMQVQIN
ncbi:MAG: M24 family metallopeptidase [Planctomycetota bacterium]